MNRFLILAMIVSAPFAGCNTPGPMDFEPVSLNVNARYIVESVHVNAPESPEISDSLRAELNRCVGSKLDHPALEKLAQRLQRELHASDVAVKVSRGTEPDHVIVNFEATEGHQQKVDLNIAKFLYDSRQGWSGDGEAATHLAGNTFTFGMLSDSDTAIGRYTGIRAKFERAMLASKRLLLRFEFHDYHQQWNPSSVTAANENEFYRSSQVIKPEAVLAIFAPLELSFGVSFARYQPGAFGGFVPDGIGQAAKTESSNAVVTSLRYHQRWGSDPGEQLQELTGSYSLASATNLFATDANYTRHLAEARYRFRHAHHLVDVGFLGGRITGNAPLSDRFVLGNSATLRGWDKYELDPLGGSHVVHGSVDYSYRMLQLFYDAGAIWDVTPERQARQSLGAGFKIERFQLAVAIPLRSAHMVPIFYTGLNF